MRISDAVRAAAAWGELETPDGWIYYLPEAAQRSHRVNQRDVANDLLWRCALNGRSFARTWRAVDMDDVT
jgi:hypothetical protein